MKSKNNLKATDTLVKKVFSILFRVIITSLAIIILSTQQSTFPLWAYSILIAVYLIIYFYLFLKDNWWQSLLRLLNDYTFIFLILYNRDIYLAPNYVLLILPIINAPNHSGKKSYSLYPVVIIVIGLLTSWRFEVELIFPLLLLGAINVFRHYRMEVLNTKNDLADLIGQFFTSEHEFRKFHNVYDLILEHIESKNFLKRLFTIDVIVCFLVKNNRLLILNSSKFIRDYSIQNENKLLLELESKGTSSDIPIKLQDSEFEKNLFVMAQDSDVTLVFAIILDHKGTSPIGMGILEYFFKPISQHLLNIIKHHTLMRNSLAEGQSRIRKQQQYVLKSMNAMHFVRNKLSPIKTYLNLDEIEEKVYATSNEVLIKSFNSKKINALKQSKYQLTNIVQRADFILEKSDNPFIIQGTSKHKINALFSLIRFNWFSFFEDQTFKMEFLESFQDVYVEYNSEVMEIVLADIMSNINKHGNDPELTMIELENNITFYFKNKILLSENHDFSKLHRISQSYNTGENWEINKRITHGLILINLI